jgi:hypothetical protein
LVLYMALDGEGRAEGSLYEDEGEGHRYKEGVYCKSHFEAEKSGMKEGGGRGRREGGEEEGRD